MAAKVGGVIIDLRADIARFQSDLGKATSKLQSTSFRMNRSIAAMERRWQRFGRTIGRLGIGVTLASVTFGAGRAVQSLTEIANTADKLGITAEELQELRFAAERFGIAANTSDLAIQRFTRRLGEARQGSGELKSTLDQYNITAGDTLETLETLADVIANAESEQEQLRIAFKAFDSEGAAFVNVLRLGSQGLREIRREAHATNRVIGQESAEAARDLKRAYDDIVGQLERGAQRVVIAGSTISAVFADPATLPTGRLKAAIEQLEKEVSDGVSFIDRQLDLTENRLARFRAELARRQTDDDKIELPNIVSDEDFLTDLIGLENQIKDVVNAQLTFGKTAGFIARVNAEQQIYNNLLKDGARFTDNQREKLELFLNDLENSTNRFVDLQEAQSLLFEIDPIAAYNNEADRLRQLLPALVSLTGSQAAAQSVLDDALRRSAEAALLASETMEGGFARALEGLEQNLTNLDFFAGNIFDQIGDATKQLVNDMINEFIRLSIIKPLFDSIFAALGVGGGGFSFGGFFADGGRPPIGKLSVVGERGPEFIAPRSAVDVIPASDMAVGVGGVAIHQEIHFDVGLESVDERIAQSAPSIARAAAAGVVDAQQRSQGKLI